MEPSQLLLGAQRFGVRSLATALDLGEVGIARNVTLLSRGNCGGGAASVERCAIQ